MQVGRIVGLTLVGALATLVASVASAPAASISVSSSGANVSYLEQAAAQDSVAVAETTGEYVFWAAQGGLQDGDGPGGCYVVNAYFGQCAKQGVTLLTIQTGALDDTVVATATVNVATNVNGGTGNDTITGGNGKDVLNGGSGNDTITGGAGADAIVGAGGTDTASYSASTSAVYVSLDGAANDGGAPDDDPSISGPANDNVQTENVTGGAGSDQLTGDNAPNTLRGNANGNEPSFYGIELLNGNGGNDVLIGDAGLDAMLGGSGADALIGGLGQDLYFGGSGSDLMVDAFGDIPAGGLNSFNAADDTDADTVICGEGTDEVSKTAVDAVTNPDLCESITTG